MEVAEADLEAAEAAEVDQVVEVEVNYLRIYNHYLELGFQFQLNSKLK